MLPLLLRVGVHATLSIPMMMAQRSTTMMLPHSWLCRSYITLLGGARGDVPEARGGALRALWCRVGQVAGVIVDALGAGPGPLVVAFVASTGA